MNLIVDIGNSSAKAAVFEGDKMVLRKRLASNLPDSLGALAKDWDIRACAFSIVGKQQADMAEVLQHIAPYVLHVKGNTPTPLTCDYQTPDTLGADRLAAATAAAMRYAGQEVMVVDIGTCITYDFVNSAGHYLGGNISPGMGIRLRALHEQTARLPLVQTEGDLPDIGYNTATAIRAGVLHGMELEIKGYISRFSELHPNGHTFMTGGNAARFAHIKGVEIHDALVETGLNLILQHNLQISNTPTGAPINTSI